MVFNYYGLSDRNWEDRQTGGFGWGGVVVCVWIFFPVNIDAGVGLVRVRDRKILFYPFGESISPMGLLLLHIGVIFSIFPHSFSSAPLASSPSSGTVIDVFIIARVRVDWVGCVNDLLVPPLFPTS